MHARGVNAVVETLCLSLDVGSDAAVWIFESTQAPGANRSPFPDRRRCPSSHLDATASSSCALGAALLFAHAQLCSRTYRQVVCIFATLLGLRIRCCSPRAILTYTSRCKLRIKSVRGKLRWRKNGKSSGRLTRPAVLQHRFVFRSQ